MAKASNDRKLSPWLEESERWDRMSLEEILAASEPDDTKFVDRRPRKAISLRVDEELILAAKRAADELGLGYQTLFRMWLIEGLKQYRRQKIATHQSKRTRPAV